MKAILAFCLALPTLACAQSCLSLVCDPPAINVTPSALPTNPGDLGFRCGFSLAEDPRAVMLFADGSDAQVPRRALITINGRPIFLKPTGLKLILQNPREGISVGDTEEMDFAAEGVRVHVLATVTGVCPPESDEDPTCEVTEYAATIDVTSGTSSVSIDTVGTCGS